MRRTRWSRVALAFAASVVIAFGARVGDADVEYDTLAMGGGQLWDMNDVGTVLFTDPEFGWRLYRADGSYVDMDYAPPGWSFVHWVGLIAHDAGEPLGAAWGVGATEESPNVNVPLLWSPANGIIPLLPAGATVGTLMGGDERGIMFGNSDRGAFCRFVGSQGNPFECPQAGVLGRPSVQRSNFANGRAIVGFSEPVPRSYVWDVLGGTLRTLDIDDWGTAIDVNSAGEACGRANQAGYDEQPVYWSANGARTDLGSLLPSDRTGDAVATHISDSGWVAGGYQWVDGYNDPVTGEYVTGFASVFIWNARDNSFHDLSDDLAALGIEAAFPMAVAEDGTVAIDGYGSGAGAGNESLLIWTPDAGLSLPGGAYGAYFLGMNKSGKYFYWPSGGEVVVVQNVDGISVTTSIEQGGSDGMDHFDLILNDSGRGADRFINDRGQFVHWRQDVQGVWYLKTPLGTTEVGSGVPINLDPAHPETETLVFENISVPGETTVFAYDVDDPDAPAVPADFSLLGTGMLFNISTTATFSGTVALALHYDDTGIAGGQEHSIRLLHFEDGQWEDVADYARPGGYLDTTNNIVYGITTSLSPFAIVVRNTIRPGIDVKPGKSPNKINLRGKGRVKVAILSLIDFDAADVEVSTVRVGNAPVSKKNDGAYRTKLEDVDGDGRVDLVVKVKIKDLDATTADTSLLVVGETTDGVAIEGSDAVTFKDRRESAEDDEDDQDDD